MGKKTVMLIVGVILVIAVVAFGSYFNLSAELITTIATAIGGLFGLTITTHFITDVSAIFKGLQTPKASGTAASTTVDTAASAPSATDAGSSP